MRPGISFSTVERSISTMTCNKLLFQWFLLVLSISTTVSISPHRVPIPSPVDTTLQEQPNSIHKTLPNDLETFLYDQTLDHFNYKPESYATFKQRYFINSKYWGGAKSSAPIFAYLGEESDLEGDLQVIGFLEKNAPHFKALILYIEHRFYGKSNPVGSMEKALKNITARSYFSSAQALADYAEILVYLKKTLSAQKSPIIVIGASYGGMLASWFRLKYPHIALGALASSAPILYFEDITPQDGYYSVVTKDFQEESESCYMTIKESWAEIDRIASKPDGLSILSQRFKTCTPLTELSELIDYLDTGYAGAAQYNSPSRNPVHKLCGGIDGTATGADILDKIFAGVVARSGNSSCYNMTSSFSNDTLSGWGWQTCSEMVMPIGITKKDSIYPPAPFLLSEFINDCKKKYGITPRPHWITTYYGGHDIKLVLSKFASNIIFSNGLKDPYSSGGVLEDISDSVLAITAVNGSHCLDVLTEREDDPEWLINQRAIEVTIIKGWIKKYYQDLRASQK